MKAYACVRSSSKDSPHYSLAVVAADRVTMQKVGDFWRILDLASNTWFEERCSQQLLPQLLEATQAALRGYELRWDECRLKFLPVPKPFPDNKLEHGQTMAQVKAFFTGLLHPQRPAENPKAADVVAGRNEKAIDYTLLADASLVDTEAGWGVMHHSPVHHRLRRASAAAPPRGLPGRARRGSRFATGRRAGGRRHVPHLRCADRR